jgi:hypothetical protein
MEIKIKSWKIIFVLTALLVSVSQGIFAQAQNLASTDYSETLQLQMPQLTGNISVHSIQIAVQNSGICVTQNSPLSINFTEADLQPSQPVNIQGGAGQLTQSALLLNPNISSSCAKIILGNIKTQEQLAVREDSGNNFFAIKYLPLLFKQYEIANAQSSRQTEQAILSFGNKIYDVAAGAEVFNAANASQKIAASLETDAKVLSNSENQAMLMLWRC